MNKNKEIAGQICNTVGVVDLYPNIYKMAWNIQYKGKITVTQKKELTTLQSKDVRQFGYVPETLLIVLKSIV